MQVLHALQSETEEGNRSQIRDGAYKSKQASLFEQQLDLAVELGLNVVIHQRDAWDDTLEIMRPYTGKVRGVFHCFGGSLEQANEVLDLGHLVSFTGIVTFKNGAAVREVAAQIPLWKFMVETDCPYLAPVPFRGKRCEPAYTRLVAESIAAARGIPLGRNCSRDNRNCRRILSIQSHMKIDNCPSRLHAHHCRSRHPSSLLRCARHATSGRHQHARAKTRPA